MFRQLALLLLFCVALPAQSLLPTSGVEALQWNARALTANSRIAFIAHAPGDEDLALAARLKLVVGSRIRFVYISNGEASGGALAGTTPNEIAATLRGRAYTISAQLGSSHQFLNFAHIDAASSSAVVRSMWNVDSLRERIVDALRDLQPDLIVVNGLEELSENHPLRRVLVEEVRKAAGILGLRQGEGPAVAAVSESSDRPIPDFPEVTRRHGKSFRSVVEQLQSVYSDVARGDRGVTRQYASIRGYPTTQFRRSSDIGTLLRKRLPPSLASTDSTVRALSRSLASLKSLPSGAANANLLKRVFQVRTIVDQAVYVARSSQSSWERFLLDWIEPLEEIRNTLLGVKVRWSLSDTVLTHLQVTYLNVDSVVGLDPKGKTELYFPSALQGWFINEEAKPKVEYVPGSQIRILSGRNIPFDLPRSLVGLDRPVYRSPWFFFVVHQASKPERSFSARIDVGFIMSPRLTTEVLTPLVAARTGEEVVVRLTNHSRDGLRDTVRVMDSIVVSSGQGFRLSTKEASVTTALSLRWIDDLEVGIHIVDILIGQDPVARFAGKRFVCKVDTGAAVAVVSGGRESSIVRALRRIGVASAQFLPEELTESALRSFRTVIIEEYVGTALSSRIGGWKVLDRFVNAGGHIVLMTQSPEVLKESGWWSGTTSVRSADFDAKVPLIAADTVRLFVIPNDLRDETWDDWLFRRSTHRLTAGPAASVAARVGAEGVPSILRTTVGTGTVHYVDLNMEPQLLNVLPVAYRLLANLIAY